MDGVAHDYVVEDFDFERLAGSDEIAGDFDVRRGRRFVPASPHTPGSAQSNCLRSSSLAQFGSDSDGLIWDNRSTNDKS